MKEIARTVKLASITTFVIVMTVPDCAWAAGRKSLGVAAATAKSEGSYTIISKNLASSLENIPSLIASLSYLFATLLSVQGILKMKEHIEGPEKTPISVPLTRLLTGAALMALPILTEAMQGTLDTSIAAGPRVAEMQKVAFNVGL